jgi:MFS family permease
MMTGGALGTFIGAWVYGLVGGYGWRYVFFVGIVPAIILAIMRGRMLEPERIADVRERRRAVAAGLRRDVGDREFMRFVPFQLFSKEHRYNTMVGVLFGLGSLCDLDHEYLAADDPVLDGAKERCGRRHPRQCRSSAAA